MKKKFRKTSKMMEGLCFVISVTGLNMPGKDGDDDDDKYHRTPNRDKPQ
jgi:hypothetical protein